MECYNMKNRILVHLPHIQGNQIIYHYEVEGIWSEAFRMENTFSVVYSIDITSVPFSVAIVPLLANILPIAWVYDAEIIVPSCDRDFYNCIADVKKGYCDMYPMMNFGGILSVDRIEENLVDEQSGSCAFFSGGVDAFNTLTQHISEKPTLITLCGADIALEDEAGWNRVENHLEETCNEFGLDFVTVKTSFRDFLREGVLGSIVRNSGDGWWHGFQHGIGIICHAAPVMYALGKKTAYFASSFTAADKGRVTCASDPTIDNYVRFCGCNIVHDGYEFTRQMKIHNITQFSKESGKRIPLRVCWESTGGSNCCNCEKCWRTILGLYAEGVSPENYGFHYSMKQLSTISKKMKSGRNPMFSSLRYQPIQSSMQNNIEKEELPKPIRWFYNIDLKKYDTVKLYRRIWRKILYYIRN